MGAIESSATNLYSDGVLILTYRRHENLEKILDICLSNSSGKIYITSDGPRSLEDFSDITKVREKIENYKQNYPDRIAVNFHTFNWGASVSMITSCQNLFSRENFGVIIEDDCIPHESLFLFAENAKKFIEENSNIFIATGSNFGLNSNNKMVLSRYPIIWGWMTTSMNWKKFYGAFVEKKFRSPFSLSCESLSEKFFWFAGYRRAHSGYIDAWDTILAADFLHRKGLCLVPPVNLITNVGNDSVALHTELSRIWHRVPSSQYLGADSKVEIGKDLDLFLQKRVYGINRWRIATTSITWCRDLLGLVKPKRCLRRRLISYYKLE